MNQALLLANLGNLGLLVSAALTTASVAAYHIRYHTDRHGKWWSTPFGWHLMVFMAAFAVVLDESVVYLLTGPGLIVSHAVLPRPDWFAWVRVVSFDVLIPGVTGWRLAIIIWPPRS